MHSHYLLHVVLHNLPTKRIGGNKNIAHYATNRTHIIMYIDIEKLTNSR